MRNLRLSIALGIGACGLALALAGCNRSPKGIDRASTATPAASPKREGALVLLAPPGYVERGDAEHRIDWVSGFEQRTGCQVQVETVAGEPELLARMAGEGIDAAIVPGELALTLVANGDVRAIEPDRVPGLAGVAPRVRDGAAVERDGRRFAVPFVWRPLVLRYRIDAFPQPPSTDVLYVAQSLSDKHPSTGRVQAIDSPLAIAAAALFLARTQPALGIDDPYALDATQYAAALAVLREQKGLLHRYWDDRAEQDADFTRAGIVAASGWAGGDWRRASVDAADAAAVAWVAPAEGAIARVDDTMLHARAAHPNCAYAWLEWSLDPAVQAQAAYWLGAVPAVPAACVADSRLGEVGCRAYGGELLAQARFARTPTAHCARAGGCVPYSRWTQDYYSIRGE